MAPDDPPRPRRLLRTKLFVPRVRAQCVPRPRLHARLDQGAATRLTLVCAAAGWGKTTLVTDWLTRTGRPAAWVSLDEADAESSRLLAYVVAALRRLHPGLVPEVDLDALEPADPELVITEVLNGLAEWGQDTTLVLDDLHHIESDCTHALLAFFIDAAPPNLHVVITTRVDPSLPLPRLRARGELVEIRAPDLRFSADEMQAFFADAMGLPLPEAALRQLATRTEGWAAGLQMAALSLRGRDDVEAFIEGFAGSHRFVLDYLMEEVLAKMPVRRRQALLRLSILRELSAPVVDALVEGGDGQAILEGLEAENLFLVALDDTRRTYRFHHLFGTLLQHELAGSIAAEELAGLHVRAAQALERLEAWDEAFHHAIEGGDFDRAQRLLLADADMMIIRRAHEWISVRLDRFGAEELARRPALLVKQAWVRSANQRRQDTRRAVAEAKEALRRFPDPAVSAELLLFEAVQAQGCDDIERARALMDEAERDLDPDNALMRSVLIMHRAFDHVASDRFDEASAEAATLAAEAARVGDDFTTMWARWFGAQMALLQGRPRETIQIMESMIPPLRARFGARPPQSAGIGFVTLTLAHHARGELEPAIEWVERALDVMDPRLDPGSGCALVLAQAELEVARDPEGGGWKEALAHGERLIADTDMPGFAGRLQVHRVRHTLDVRTPDDPEPVVRRWLAVPGILDDDHPVHLGVPYATSRTGFARVVLARSLAFVGQLARAREIAEDALSRAQRAGRKLCEVEAQMALADVAMRSGDDRARQIAIAGAVEAAAGERLVSPFFGHADVLVDAALAHARARGHTSLAGYLAGYPRTRHEVAAARPRGRGPTPRAMPAVEPLSERELEVLALVSEGMSNAEVGRSLFVAPSTVKKHLEHVYDKLGVRRRTQAVARARELGLL